MTKIFPKIIFLGTPSRGHIMPTLSLVKNLLKLNCTVTYYNTAHFQELIEQSGAKFSNYQSHTLDTLSIPISIMKPHELTIELQKAFFIINNEVLPHIITDHNKVSYNVVIYDQMALWGQIFADQYKLLSFCSNTMFIFNKQDIIKQLPEFISSIDNDYEIKLSLLRNNITSIYNYEDILDIQTAAKANYVIAYYPDNLHTLPDNFDKNKVLYLGNRFDSAYNPSTAEITHAPLIYISLGTVFNDKIDLFQLLIKILGNTEYKVVISTGGNERIYEFLQQENDYNNIIIYKFIDQLEILNKASIFITHAGFNSMYEGLYFAVPMLVLPHVPEQYFNAQKIRELNAGYFLDSSTISYDNLSEALESIKINWHIYKTNSINIRNNFIESMNNSEVAAHLFEIFNYEQADEY